jgi:hypothetical protein
MHPPINHTCIADLAAYSKNLGEFQPKLIKLYLKYSFVWWDTPLFWAMPGAFLAKSPTVSQSPRESAHFAFSMVYYAQMNMAGPWMCQRPGAFGLSSVAITAVLIGMLVVESFTNVAKLRSSYIAGHRVSVPFAHPPQCRICPNRTTHLLSMISIGWQLIPPLNLPRKIHVVNNVYGGRLPILISHFLG